MNTYEKILSLGLSGTDTENAAKVAALTLRDVPITDVAAWLRERSLWIKGPDSQLGSLYAIYAATDNEQVKAGLADFYAAVFSGQAQMLRMTRVDIATKVAGVLAIISGVLPDGPAIITEFYAMAGGRPWASATAELIATQRTAAQALTAKQNALSVVEQAHESAKAEYRSANGTPESIIAAAVAVLEAE